MKRVTGIGGIFFKCRDRKNTMAWYEKHLGIPMQPWGAQFYPEESSEGSIKPYSVLSMFEESSDYLAPSESPFMINFRVADLDALLEHLRAEGVTIVGDPMADEFGKFAWIMDPEGNKIELWQQTQ